MSNANHNNDGWRGKLEALDDLPGETVIDKNASWGKLHNRLREKRSRKKITWYWSAAACLLLVLMVPLNKFMKSQEPPKTGTVQKHPGKTSAPSTLIDKKDSILIIAPATLEKNQTIAVADKNIEKRRVVISTAEIGKNPLADAVSNRYDEKKNIVTALQPLDTSLNIAAALPVNKKLKVVHINELGDPVEESPVMARNADIHSFKLKLANQEVYINSSVASRANGFTIFKSKTSPN